MTGDFYQLPPVNKGGIKYAFDAHCWKTNIDRIFNLKTTFRQRDESKIKVHARIINRPLCLKYFYSN